MHVYLIRHGIAMDREDPKCPPDTERALTPKGIKRSRAAAEGLRALDIMPNVVLTSPWLRAAQTAEIFCETIGYPARKIIRTNALKGTSPPADLMHELQSIKAKIVFCFGHEPHLHL
ncbi:MAG TPA: phosphoglycerate mutase family protein, partial [Candidatus Acidoferrales bacterium]